MFVGVENVKNYNFNKEELLNHYNLLKKVDNIQDLNKSKVFIHDMFVIQSLLKEFNVNIKFDTNYSNFFNFDLNIDINKIYNFFLIPYMSIKKRYINIKKIEKINDDIIKSFLSNYDVELLNIYNEIIENKKVIIHNKSISATGYVQNLLLFNKFYIFIKKNDFMHITLVHEIAHIKQIKLCKNNIDKIENLYSSLFIEMYPKYLELKFIKYLSDNNYHNIVLKWQQEFFNNLSIYIENIHSCLDKNIINLRLIKNYISSLLAINFINLDDSIMLDLNKFICINDNEKSFEYIKKISNKTSIKNNLNNYLKEYIDDLSKYKNK